MCLVLALLLFGIGLNTFFWFGFVPCSM